MWAWVIGYLILSVVVTLCAARFMAFSNITPEEEQAIREHFSDPE